MSIVKCPECGATDSFVSYQLVPTRFFVERIEQDSDGCRIPIYSGGSEIWDHNNDDAQLVCEACHTDIDWIGEKEVT
jgi:hypothetical protein